MSAATLIDLTMARHSYPHAQQATHALLALTSSSPVALVRFRMSAVTLMRLDSTYVSSATPARFICSYTASARSGWRALSKPDKRALNVAASGST